MTELSPFRILSILLYPGVMAVIVFRIASAFHRSGLRPLSRLLYVLNLMLFGVDLGPGARVGRSLLIAHPVGVSFGSHVVFGSRVRLMGMNAIGGGDDKNPGLPRIGDACLFLYGAKVLAQVTLGDGVVVGANSVVLDDVPANAVVVGTPARVIRYQGAQETGA